jgi:predicted metalloprotease with PDZ domain
MSGRHTPILLCALLFAFAVVAGDDSKCKAAVRECDLQIRQLMSGRRYLGATISDEKPGLVVTKIVERGPAHRAGILVGDRLVVMNGKSLASASTREFKQILAEARQTGRLMIIVMRDGQYKRIIARLEPYTKEQLDKMIAAHVAQSHTSTAGGH